MSLGGSLPFLKILNEHFFKGSSQDPLVTVPESMFAKIIFQRFCRFWAFLENYNLHKYYNLFHPRSVILAKNEETFLLNDSSVFYYAKAQIQTIFCEENLVKVTSEIERKNRNYTSIKFCQIDPPKPLTKPPKNLVKHQKVSKHYENDCLRNFLLLFMSLLTAAINKNGHI